MSQLQVSIRMYRVGELGDCFLLRFRDGEDHSSVLIDCGSFRNGETSVNRMRAIAEHIESTLEGKPLDVVVGTHQHNDHLSGFKHADDVFLRMKAKEGWLSWLDEPGNKNAERIEEEVKGFKKTLKEIRSALAGTENTGELFSRTAERLHDMMGFYTDEEDLPAAKASEKDAPEQPRMGVKKDPVVPSEGLKVLRAMSNRVSYLRPGEELKLPGIGSEKVRVHVLGPPENDGLLFDIHAKKDETYDPHLKGVHETAKGFLLAMSNFDKNRQTDPDEAYFPFDRIHQKPLSNPDFQNSNYYGNDWQRIDTDWLYQSERLALYLDSYTNNTSLVLAFELVESGKVLLFVGDAQTGNWLSWDTITWKDKPVGFHVNNLLAKTVFYKVGHHCSHNATLVSGLERMTHSELIAMIPVDRTDGNITKANGWKMPAKNLYQRLKEKTDYRLIRMDDIYDEECHPEKSEKAKDSWEKVPVEVKVDEGPDGLFVECTIK